MHFCCRFDNFSSPWTPSIIMMITFRSVQSAVTGKLFYEREEEEIDDKTIAKLIRTGRVR